MSDLKAARLGKLTKEFNLGLQTMVDYLKKKGIVVEANPNTKISPEAFDLLQKEFGADKSQKKDLGQLLVRPAKGTQVTVSINDIHPNDDGGEQEDEQDEVLIKDPNVARHAHDHVEIPRKKMDEPKVLGMVDLSALEKKPKAAEPKKEEPAPVKASAPKVAAKTKKEEPVEPVTPEVKPKKKETAKAKKAEPEHIEPNVEKLADLKVLGTIDLEDLNKPKTKKGKGKKVEEAPAPEPVVPVSEVVEQIVVPAPAAEEAPAVVVPPAEVEDVNFIRAKVEKLTGPTVLGKMDLSSFEEREKKKPVASSSDPNFNKDRKKKRKRIPVPPTPGAGGTQTIDAYLGRRGGGAGAGQGAGAARKGPAKRGAAPARPEVSEEDIQKQVKDTLARLTSKGSKSKTSKYRREKREELRQREQAEVERQEADKNILKVTEFVTVNELASMMNVQAIQVIQVCMNMGLFVSINQRLDAEHLSLVADEFNYKVEFVTADLQEMIEEDEDTEELLAPRPPIVTVMGHVDHGKTKLLDYIRKTNVIAGEAGGITQHIGAYGVQLEDGRQITFLDTPGHEAFTAMRARGASITDVAIIVIAADDGVMPQTVEAINHAQAAGVPMVFAINKVDKPTANPEKIKEALANMNLLVEDWGGKYQSQEISAKEGKGIMPLLEKVLLEAEMLDLRANADRLARGTVIESMLDKGRGYLATMLVETGTLRVGDLVLAGPYYGHVKALQNERGKKIEEAGPSTPMQILGLNGAPQAGDKFNVMRNEREAKDIAIRREQLQREQGLRTQKHITLDEIGRRIAIGNFQELNIIVKGDVDGSIEALSDSLIKLSTPEVQVNVIHKAVGAISESDILLAAASNAIIVGFQVRPSMNARKLAEKEQIDIRLYSIIYTAINEIKDAILGMLSPEVKEEIVATVEVLETYKITKVGTVAGCIVRDGKLTRNTKIRIIRDGIVIYSGELASLKRFKDDVKEVTSGMECGLNIHHFNDIKVSDIIEGYTETEVKRVL